MCIAQLEAAIEADPHDMFAWEARLCQAVNQGDPGDWFEKAVTQWPTGARIWATYAEWCEAQEAAKALAVYKRCLQAVPSLDLWISYLHFSKRHRPLEDIFAAYREAVDMFGTDSRAGFIWSEYLAFYKRAYNLLEKKLNPDAEVSGRLLAEDANPIDAARRALRPQLRKQVEETPSLDSGDEAFLRVADELGIDVSAIRAVFQRAVCTAHAVLDKIWVAYEQFEKSLGNPQFAQKVLGEYQPRYMRAKAVFKELQTVSQGIDFLAAPVPLRPHLLEEQRRHMERWRRFLHYERTNPLRLDRQDLQVRVSLVYQQASLSLAYHADIWYDFSSWLDLCGQQEKATQLLQQAVQRFLPHDLTLRLLLAHRHELQSMPPSPANLQEAEAEYQKLLEDMGKPCPLALINKLAFTRRQKGATLFRESFLDATESSAHCTWEVYVFAALTEYHVFGQFEAAVKVFRLGLERYGDREPSLLAAYVNFLTGANDLKSARAELSRGVLDHLQVGVRNRLANRGDLALQESLAFLWQKWMRMERYFGDAAAVRRAIAFRDEEYRNLQRDQDVEEDAVAETPVSLGLSASIAEVEEGFRFQHLLPRTTRMAAASTAPPASKSVGSSGLPAAVATESSAAQGGAVHGSGAQPADAGSAAASAATPVAGSMPPPPAPPQTRALTVDDVVDESRRFSCSTPVAACMHIARPDVSKMLAFRPALDVVGPRRMRNAPANGQFAKTPTLPTMIPKCLQDLLAVLPSRSLKGAKPDVDYMLTVLQTVTIPPIPVKELENFRYDSLRLSKDDEGIRGKKRLIKEEANDQNAFFNTAPSFYRDRLQAKRRKLMGEVPAVGKQPESAAP